MRVHPGPAVTILLLAVTSICSGTSSSSSTSSSTSCAGNVCEVDLSGAQTLDIELGSFERDLRIDPIEPDAVTVSARGDQARLAAGEDATVGGLAVRIISVDGRDVSLEVRRG
ncbi:MAG: hypothetical protein ACRDRH_28360 [Pseudonocardia sp.]